MLCRHEWEWEQSLLGGEFKGKGDLYDDYMWQKAKPDLD